MDITEQLIEKSGFQRCSKSSREELDFDQFTCMKRIHIVHYLFYSENFKHFSIAVRHDDPKKDTTGRLLQWTIITLPKVIQTWEEAKGLIDAICNENILKVL